MHGRFGRTFARAMLVALALGILAPGWGDLVAAETPPAKRWLLVLETSSTMERRKEGALQTINALLSSRMGGQLTPGDTIGVWTFNSQLFTGQLPLKRWSAESADSIQLEILQFVHEQSFGRRPDVAEVLPAVSKVISNSLLITVIIIGSGEGTIAGTPFDAAINETWGTWRSPQQKAKMPILTVLRGVDGRISAQVVSPAQYSVEWPPLPEPPPAAVSTSAPAGPAKAAQSPRPEKPAPPQPKAPPLIISGKKEQTNAVAIEPTNVVSASVPQPSMTNHLPAATGPVPATATNAPPAVTGIVTNASAVAAAPARDVPKAVEAEKPKSGREESQVEASKTPEPAPAVASAVLPAGKSEVQPERHVKWMWVAGICVVVFFLVAGYLVRRPGRKRSHTSLITESLDRHDDI